MRKSTEYVIFGLILLLSISLRYYYSYSQNTFQTDESYSVLRQVENIKNTGIPLYYDPLSYSGRESVFNPGYYYVMYALSVVFGEKITFKFIPILFATLGVLAVYIISKKLANAPAAIVSSLISIFIPIYTVKTTNTILPYTLVVPLFFLCLHLFSNVTEESKEGVITYIIALTFFSVVSSYVFIFILALLLYALLLKIEEIPLNKAKKELIIFSLIFTLWVQFLFYKKALLVHGPKIIWQNIPIEFIVNYFTNINILIIIYYVGIIPFFYALYIIYKYTFKAKDEGLYLYISLTTVITLLLIFRLVRLQIGLMILGFCFVIFYSLHFKQLMSYIDKTRFSKYKPLVVIFIILMFLFTSIGPTVASLNKRQSVPESSIAALNWISQNTDNNSIILGTINEGNVITYIAKRKNIIDTNFLLIRDINERVNDIETMYTSPSLVKALELLSYYNIDYILLDDARTTFSVESLRYASPDCIVPVYDTKPNDKVTENNTLTENHGIKVYKVLCKVQKYE